MRSRKQLVLAVVGVALVVVWVQSPGTLSPVELAVAECEDCGMDRDWVLQTVEGIRVSGQTREQAIDAWEATCRQNNPEDLEEARGNCLPCVEAIVTAALEE